MKSEIRKLVKNAVSEQFNTDISFMVENGVNPEHGDFATNVSMQLARSLKKNPREIACQLKDAMESDSMIERIEIAGPGFINFFIKKETFHKWLGNLLKDESILKSDIGAGEKVMVEFVSANPTGPLHIGHGRGAAIGDSIARIMSAAGFDVYKEYYVNDAGVQMDKLSRSVFARYCKLAGGDFPFPEDGYQGEYILDIASKIKDVYSDRLLKMSADEALKLCRTIGRNIILLGCFKSSDGEDIVLNGSIRETLANFNVHFDNYFSEQNVYDDGGIVRALDTLRSKGALYEKDEALWLRTSDKGDEKDRVLRKSDGNYTYLTPDIAYHDSKIRRGFSKMVDVWGADHHGYIKRMESALEYLGYDKDNFSVILVQMVGLTRSGEKVKMSTRAGEFITLDWLIDEVGTDAARFFYNIRSANSQFDFDVDLAKSRSSDNPVYYVQYCHARIKSLFAAAEEKGICYKLGCYLELLTLDSELNIIKKIADFKNVIEMAAIYREPHRVAFYLQELASDFHSYYYNNTILSQDLETTSARLSLAAAVAMVVNFGLSLLGVSAPERM